MAEPQSPSTEQVLQRAIASLDSVIEGGRAAETLIGIGTYAVPFLERLLLDSPPRSISMARCRAARALGELGAYSSLLKYFRRYAPPGDAAVLFAEDAVRSAAARELIHSPSDETFRTLLEAVTVRATNGLIEALAEYRRSESVPLFFILLEDDLCRACAVDGLRKVSNAARAFALLFLRGCTSIPNTGAGVQLRLRATLRLLAEIGVDDSAWCDLRVYLYHDDVDCVIAAARIGLKCIPQTERASILEALIDASPRMNWAQETESIELLDEWPELARSIAEDIAARRIELEKPSWLSPLWRTLHHLLGGRERHTII